VKFIATKKVRQQIFPLFFYVLVGSGIRDGQKSGSGINIPDPQHCKRHFGMLFSNWQRFYEVDVLVTIVTAEGVFTTNISLSYSYYTMSKIDIPSGEKYILAEQRKIKKFNMVHLACFLKKGKTEN
jgi:hypothetical protein